MHAAQKFTLQFSTRSIFIYVALLTFLSLSATVHGQSTQPDYVALNPDTAPNVLLVEITSTSVTNDGIEIEFTVGNPLKTLYLPFDISGNPAALELVSETDVVWHNIGLIPPASLLSWQRTLTYRARFTSTDQSLQVESRVLDVNNLVFNAIEIASNHLLGSVSPDADQLALALQAVSWEQRLTAVTANLDCFSNDALTLRDAYDCAMLAVDLFKESDEFRNLVVDVLRELGMDASRSAVDLFIDGRDFIKKWGNISDGIVYVGLNIRAGQGGPPPIKWSNSCSQIVQ